MYQRMDRIINYIRDFEVTFEQVFWFATIAFLATSAAIWVGRTGDVGYVFYLQVAAGLTIFATSKIGRAFLGLE